MGLARDGYGAGQFAQRGCFGDGIEKRVDEVLYPARVEVAGVMFLDDAAIDDAGLGEFRRVDDGAVGDGVEPMDFYLGAHVRVETCGDLRAGFRWGRWRDLKNEMEGMVAVGECAKLKRAIDSGCVGQSGDVGREDFIPGAAGQDQQGGRQKGTQS